MRTLFYNCENLNNLDLYSFNTKNVNNIGFIFYGYNNLEDIYSSFHGRNEIYILVPYKTIDNSALIKCFEPQKIYIDGIVERNDILVGIMKRKFVII